MNNFFSNGTINLNIDRELHTDKTNVGDPVTIDIDKYKNRPSIEKICQENFPKSNFLSNTSLNQTCSKHLKI